MILFCLVIVMGGADGKVKTPTWLRGEEIDYVEATKLHYVDFETDMIRKNISGYHNVRVQWVKDNDCLYVSQI